MLTSLHIKNYAIIKEVNLTFERGLHVITGETGAGKSIMLGALGLVLGERTKSISRMDPEAKTMVEAQFDITGLHLEALFAKNDIDFEPIAIVRREINPQGRSRAFVNDSPVQIAFLQNLAQHLIEVHQQFDQLALRESSFQYDVLDILAKQKTAVVEYQSKYSDWLAYQKKLEEQKQLADQLKAEEDFLQFQLDELLEFAVDVEADDQLGDQQTLLSRAEEIQNQIQYVDQNLNGADFSLIDHIGALRQALQPFTQIKAIEEVVDRLNATETELDDIHQTVLQVHGEVEFDPQKLAKVEERLSTFFRLRKKHQVETAQELLQVQESIDTKLQKIGHSDQEIKSLESTIASTRKELEKQAKKLSASRNKAIPPFEENIQAHLRELGMPDAILQVAMRKTDLGQRGIDDIEFLFSSNKGIPPSPIKLTASGGEISRLNLAIKSEVAGEMALPTIIFDEIDAGVSGEVARKISTLLQELSVKHQIICITHTPQIASSPATHLHVSKDNSGERTFTVVEALQKEARVQKLAEMLDGVPPSPEAIKNAKSLLAR